MQVVFHAPFPLPSGCQLDTVRLYVTTCPHASALHRPAVPARCCAALCAPRPRTCSKGAGKNIVAATMRLFVGRLTGACGADPV